MLLSCSRPGLYSLSGCLRRSGCSADSYVWSWGSNGVSGAMTSVSAGGFSDGGLGPPGAVIFGGGTIGLSTGNTFSYA